LTFVLVAQSDKYSRIQDTSRAGRLLNTLVVFCISSDMNSRIGKMCGYAVRNFFFRASNVFHVLSAIHLR